MTLSHGADEAALARSYLNSPPIERATAKEMLSEAKQILDQLGVVFFLRQGTCLGAVRDHDFIPWDDDLDLGSVIGLHGQTEESIDGVAAAFMDQGYFVQIQNTSHYINLAMVKSSVRIDWACFRIIEGGIFHYPGIRLPIRLFTQLKEIDFIEEKFLVPNPPDEYLSIKYGPSWTTPKKAEWTTDVVQMIPEGSFPGRGGRLRQLLAKNILRWRAGRLRVLDAADNPVAGADVMAVGLGRSKTNKQGYARLYLPDDDFYALVIKYGNHEELLYEEQMAPGETYVYRPDPLSVAGRKGVLSRE